MLNKLTDVTYKINFALIYKIFNFLLWRLITKYQTYLVLFQHSRPKIARGHVNLISFPESPSICPVQSLKDYLVRTTPLRAIDAQHMIIQLKLPHNSLPSQTLSLLDNVYDSICRCGNFHIPPAHYSQSLGCMVRVRIKNMCGPDLQTRSIVQTHHHI